jgi:urease accessory protein
MITKAAMRTDPMLTVAQWFSPSFPIGAFAYSHGVEQAIADSQIRDVASLSDWIETVLCHGSGHNDAVFLAASFHGDSQQVDAYARAFAASKERLMETDLQGTAFCKIVTDLTGYVLSGLTYPVAVGAAASLAELPLSLTTSMYLQAFVSSLVSDGIRLIPIGQTDGHNIIAKLSPLCSDIAGRTQSGDFTLLTSTAFASDIAAMRHETLTSRVFRT